MTDQTPQASQDPPTTASQGSSSTTGKRGRGQQQSQPVEQQPTDERSAAADERSAGVGETAPEEADVEEVPPPEPPIEVGFDLSDNGVRVGAIHTREDVGLEDGPDVPESIVPDDDTDRAEREREEREEREQPIDVTPVEGFQVISNTRGMAISINGGEAYAFNDQMAAALKHEIDAVIVGLAL